MPQSVGPDGSVLVASTPASVATQPVEPRRNNRFLSRKFVLGLMLVVLTLAVYGQVCRFDFIVLDDPSYVKFNRYVLDGLRLSSLKWAILQFNDANWIPLTWLSLMLDATIYGRWPDGYHITNVLLHVTNVLLVFVVLTRMTRSVWRSAFVAALFAIHPLHAESVAWVTERKDVLCTLFGLLSLGAYVRYADQLRRSAYLAAFCLLLLSLLSKQTYVTLPCVFLLLDYWPLRRFGAAADAADSAETAEAHRASFRQLVVEKIPFFVMSGAFSAIAVWAQTRGGIRSLDAVPFRARVLNAIDAYG